MGDRAALERAFGEYGPIDGVVHLAALLSVPESVARPLVYHRNNVTAAATLIETAVHHGARAFVLSSTAAVYGHPDVQPITESTPVAPINPYGASKAAVERLLADVETAHGMRFAALRYFNACGADPEGGIGECHEPETHLIPIALEAAAGLRPALSLYGTDYPTPDGTCIRDYIHVTDLARAHVLAVEGLLEGRAGGVFNLGSGVGHSNRQVLEAVHRVVGMPVPVQLAPRRRGDPPELVADATRFREHYHWKPAHSELDPILERAWAWLSEWRGL